jgi:hypothetical protein
VRWKEHSSHRHTPTCVCRLPACATSSRHWLEKADPKGAEKKGWRCHCAPPWCPRRSGYRSRCEGAEEREDKERGRRKKRERRKKRLWAHPQRERERGERIRMTAWRDTERLKFQNLFAGGSMERIFSTMCLPTYLVSTVLDNRYQK